MCTWLVDLAREADRVTRDIWLLGGMKNDLYSGSAVVMCEECTLSFVVPGLLCL